MGTSLHIVTGQVAGSNLRQAPVKPIIRAREARGKILDFIWFAVWLRCTDLVVRALTFLEKTLGLSSSGRTFSLGKGTTSAGEVLQVDLEV